MTFVQKNIEISGTWKDYETSQKQRNRSSLVVKSKENVQRKKMIDTIERRRKILH
jgi:hypothetical protein